MGGGWFSMWPWGGAQSAPDPRKQQLERTADAFDQQKKVLDATYGKLKQVDTGMAEQQKLLADAKEEQRFILFGGSGQFVVNSMSGAISDWGHDTTGETNAALLKDMQRRLALQRERVLDAQRKMDVLSQQQVTLESWKDVDEAKMRRLCNELTSLQQTVKP